MFTIKILYTTGSTFETYEETSYIGMSWNSIEKANKAIEDIEEHYKFYKEYGNANINKRKKLLENLPKSVSVDKYGDFEAWNIKLENDSGVRETVSSFWCGYFETLHSAEVVINSKKYF